MCTLVFAFEPGQRWPLLMAANRDEMRDRPWQPPARHWPLQPDVRAGLDELGEGTWFGVADHGVVAAVLNRPGTLGPAHGRHSRGELVLEALGHATAAHAAQALADLNPQAYRGFNLVIADAENAFWLCHADDRSDVIEMTAITPGVHMITAGDLDDTEDPRIARWLPAFQSAPRPQPECGDWLAWQALLGQRADQASNSAAAMNINHHGRFGTVCSQLLALPQYASSRAKTVFLFAAGAPDRATFHPVPD